MTSRKYSVRRDDSKEEEGERGLSKNCETFTTI